MGHQEVHCNVLAVQLLVHKPADVLGQPVAVEVEVILQGRWEGEGEGEGEGGGGGGAGGERQGEREVLFEIMNEYDPII